MFIITIFIFGSHSKVIYPLNINFILIFITFLLLKLTPFPFVVSSIALNFILKSVMMSSLSLGLILLKQKGICPEIESKVKVSLSTFAICRVSVY